jgi:hypothetical protein
MRFMKKEDLSFELGTCLLMACAFTEVAQQSKARNKNEFLTAFAPVIAEATATAYKGATNDVQGKLRRVVEVWRQRSVFELPIQEAIESRIEGRLARPVVYIARVSATRSYSPTRYLPQIHPLLHLNNMY